MQAHLLDDEKFMDFFSDVAEEFAKVLKLDLEYAERFIETNFLALVVEVHREGGDFRRAYDEIAETLGEEKLEEEDYDPL